jgi:hypothetical protein
VAADFLAVARDHGLDAKRALEAWREVWQFLYQSCPLIRGRVDQCPICGGFYYRRRRNVGFCSTRCALFRQLLARRQRQVAKQINEELADIRAFEVERRELYGELDMQFSEYHKTVFASIVRPILDVDSSLHFPEAVADPHAFAVMWRFLFRSAPRIQQKIQVCSCGRLFVRYQTVNQACSRECQLRRYRRLRESPVMRPPGERRRS